VDPETVSAAQQGDALALDRLLDELAPYVRRLCARIAPAAADDATQEA
jgi:DNA-directed RNA polymerase specialized sigma24 family protein